MPKIPKEKYELKQVLKPDDMKEDLKTGSVVVTITGAEEINLPQTGNTYCLFFKSEKQSYEKPLPLNKTNLRRMIDLFGDNTDDWLTQQVVVMKALANNPKQQKEVPTLRLKGVGEE